MIKWAVGLTLLLLVSFLIPINIANANWLISDTIAAQPIGHYDFCRRLPAECQPTTVAKLIHLTNRVKSNIFLINYAINNSYGQEDDKVIYGKDEWWAFPDSRRIGDCEDFVLEKRRQLHNNGYAYSNLLITVVFRRNGEGHAVLVVRTDNGNLVLDNLTDKVIDWNATGYKFQKIVAPYNSGKWLNIDSVSNVVVGAKTN